MNANVDVTDIRIETQRLILRPWRENDLEDFYAYASVDGVGECAGWKHHETIDESKVILSLFIRHKKTLAIESKENGRVIGSIGLEELEPDPTEGEIFGRELGYVLSKDYWGRGLMTEAIQAVIHHCFDVLDFDFLTCAHFVDNHRSRRVIEKTGFQYCKDIHFESMLGVRFESKLYLQYNPNKGR